VVSKHPKNLEMNDLSFISVPSSQVKENLEQEQLSTALSSTLVGT